MHVAFSILLLASGTQGYLTFEGTPKVDKYIIKNEDVVQSAASCWIKYCKHRISCAVSFSQNGKKCYNVTISALVVFWSSDMVLKSLGDFKTLVTTSGISILAPAALWLLDDTFRLKNLGSKGAAMDWQVTGSGLDQDQGFHWNASGPHDSRARFLRYPGSLSDDFKCLFWLQKKSEYLVDFNLGFTITLWVKTEGAGQRPIMDAHVGSAYLWFETDRDQVGLNHKGVKSKEYSRTIKNSHGINDWRHIAVSYTGSGTPTFYLNGQIWSLSKKSTAEIITKDRFYTFVGRSYEHDSRACFMIFQETLSLLEIQTIMDDCP